MVVIEFNEEKNIFLKLTRGIGFEDVLEAINGGNLLDDIKNPSQKHPQQRIFVVKINSYVYAVTYVQNEEKIFLKTAYPSRVLTKSYLKNHGKNKK